MKLDTFVQLIADLRRNQMQDDNDPANVVLEMYTSPFDTAHIGESVRAVKSSIASVVWGDGTTYTVYDHQAQPFSYPSCGWAWSAGGKWT